MDQDTTPEPSSEKPQKKKHPVLAFFLGMLTGVLLVAGAAAIAVTAVPVKTYLPAENKSDLGEAFDGKSVLDVILHYDQFKLKDIPGAQAALDQALSNAGASDYVSIDLSQVGDMGINSFDPEAFYQKAVTIKATIRMIGIDNLGSLANWSVFTSSQPVPDEELSSPTYTKKLYYVDDGGSYEPAYDEEGNLKEGATSLVYPALADLPVDKILDILAPRVQVSQATDLLSQVLGIKEDSSIYKAFSGYDVARLASLDASSLKLVDFFEYSGNEKTYSILLHGTKKEKPEDLTLGDFSSFDAGSIYLVDVMSQTSENKKLFDLLADGTGKEASDILVSDLSNINVNNLHLSTILESEDIENALLRTLLADPELTLGTLDSKLQGLTLHEVYGEDCFVEKTAGKDAYSLGEDGVYTLSDDGEHSLSPTSGVWALLCFDQEDVDPSSGKVGRFVPNDKTVAQLSPNENWIGDAILGSTMYTLVETGLLKNFTNESLMGYTFQQVIDVANEMGSTSLPYSISESI